MLNKTFYIYCLIVLLVIGCQPQATSSDTPAPETQVNSDGTVEAQVTPTREIKSTVLINQCLKETSVPPVSNNIIALRSLKDVVPRQYPDIILIDMSEDPPRQTIQNINITPDFSVSPSGELIAYRASTLVNGEVTQVDLDIANGNFQIQNSMPYEDQWYIILGWTTDQRVIISMQKKETFPSSASYVLVDPKNGSQQAVDFSVSDFIDASQYEVPYWENWYGIVVDPTRRWAVYLKQNNINTEMYTYGLWDIANNRPMFSLDTILASPLYFTKASPMPIWSLDGKHFAFVGGRSDQTPGEFELFTVNVKGDIKQLTNLSSLGYVWPTYNSWSWSPDNNHIAFLVSPPHSGETHDANLAIVGTDTLEVIDLCLSVGVPELPPMWSPNGKQFLIVDNYEEDHQRVLLVDIEKNIVFPVAEDAEPIGWMVKP